MTNTNTFIDITTGDTFTLIPGNRVVFAGSSCPQDCDGGPDTDDAYEAASLAVGEWYWIEDSEGEWYVSQAISDDVRPAR